MVYMVWFIWFIRETNTEKLNTSSTININIHQRIFVLFFILNPMNPSTPEFSPFTVEITAALPKNVKKEQGIFITPRTIISKLYQAIPIATLLETTSGRTRVRMLEPSAGTCEIVRYFADLHPEWAIDAIENNETIFHRVSASGMFPSDSAVRFLRGDYLAFVPETLGVDKYDLIVGNPPYVVVGKDAVPAQYDAYMVGRPNLFGLFIVHAMSMLSPGGMLALVVPKSFLNAAYYSKIRNYLKTAGEIVRIVDFEKDGGFIDTQQSTIGFVWRKGEPDETPPRLECPYSILFGENYIFSDNADGLRELLKGSTTLAQLGLSVKTGNIVWNQRKPQLTDDSSKTVLLYNSNIAKHNEIRLLDFANDEKKQYIDMDGIRDTVIVVNRGNGNAAYKLSYARIDSETWTRPYLVENHLNVIYWKGTDAVEKKRVFDQVLRSFSNPKTEEFIRTFLGNNGLSKTELETVFPIFLD